MELWLCVFHAIPAAVVVDFTATIWFSTYMIGCCKPYDILIAKCCTYIGNSYATQHSATEFDEQ